MVPIPSEADEEARRAHRERGDLLGARRSLLRWSRGIVRHLGGFGRVQRKARGRRENPPQALSLDRFVTSIFPAHQRNFIVNGPDDAPAR
jgi:hypothetical protein